MIERFRASPIVRVCRVLFFFACLALSVQLFQRSLSAYLPRDFTAAHEFDALADWLKARGSQVEIREEGEGDISLHIVPAGIDKSSRPHDRFPIFCIAGSSVTRTVGLQGRNARPDSAAASGSRSVYALAQFNTVILEAELMKFVDEIGNWSMSGK